MKRQLKKTIVVVAALALMLTSTLSTSAAGLRDVFDAKYYTERYEDLNKAFGYNEGMLYEHYLTYGLTEGRVSSPILNVAEYREAYSDLDAAFGDNWDAYVEHYFTYGIKEGRTGGVYFDPIAYAEAYPDIKAAFGDDYVAIVNHYLTFGIEEGRTAGVVTATPSVPVGDSNTGNAGNTGGAGNSGGNDDIVSGGDTEEPGDEEIPGDTEDTSDTGVTQEPEFVTYSWTEDGTNSLFRSEETGEYYYTSYQDVGFDSMSYGKKGMIYTIYVIGNDENGENMSYQTSVQFDVSGVDYTASGTYICPGTVTVVGDIEIPFELPNIVYKIMLREISDECLYSINNYFYSSIWTDESMEEKYDGYIAYDYTQEIELSSDEVYAVTIPSGLSEREVLLALPKDGVVQVGDVNYAQANIIWSFAEEYDPEKVGEAQSLIGTMYSFGVSLDENNNSIRRYFADGGCTIEATVTIVAE